MRKYIIFLLLAIPLSILGQMDYISSVDLMSWAYDMPSYKFVSKQMEGEFSIKNKRYYAINGNSYEIVASDTIKVKPSKKAKKTAKTVKKKPKKDPPIVYSVAPTKIVSKVINEDDPFNLTVDLDSAKLKRSIIKRGGRTHVFTILPRGFESQEYEDGDSLSLSSRNWVFQIRHQEYLDSTYNKNIRNKPKEDDAEYRRLKREADEAKKRERDYLESLKKG